MSDQPVKVELCCNNPDNGTFSGKVCAVEVEYSNGESIHVADVFRGIVCRYIGNDVQIGRHKYPTFGRKSWYGNWCWDLIWMRPSDVKQLLERLRTRRWDCDSATSKLWDWWHEEKHE